jgi:hypothetical protein
VTGTISKTTSEWNALYDAHVLYIKELAIASQSFDIYRVAGINNGKLIGAGSEFVRFSSMLAQGRFVMGIESLFERKDDGVGLCSIRGLLSLAQRVPLNISAAHIEFVEKYGVKPTSDWSVDVEEVLRKERPAVAECLRLTSKLRNYRLAHLVQPSQDEQTLMIPGIDASEKIISFAYDFYCFISRGFLQSQGAQLPDRAGRSLIGLLKQRFQLEDIQWNLPH